MGWPIWMLASDVVLLCLVCSSTGVVDSTKVSGPPEYSLGRYVPEDSRSTGDLGDDHSQ